MTDTASLKSQIANLKGKTTASQLRALMPDIDRRVREGVEHETIIAGLADAGLTINLNTFRSNLYRYRAKLKGDNGRSLSAPPIAPEPQNTDRNTGPDYEPIPDGNSDGETPAPEPETVTAPNSSLNDILDPRKRDANTDQYMQRKPVLIGRNRSEKK